MPKWAPRCGLQKLIFFLSGLLIPFKSVWSFSEFLHELHSLVLNPSPSCLLQRNLSLAFPLAIWCPLCWGPHGGFSAPWDQGVEFCRPDITDPFEDSECIESEGFILVRWSVCDWGAEIWNKPALETSRKRLDEWLGSDTDMIHALSADAETFQILAVHW